MRQRFRAFCSNGDAFTVRKLDGGTQEKDWDCKSQPR